MMNWIVALIVGGVIGWIASKIMKTDRQQGVLLDVIIGVAGSILGKYGFGLLVGSPAGLGLDDGIELRSLAVALIGAVVLLGVINLSRRGRMR